MRTSLYGVLLPIMTASLLGCFNYVPVDMETVPLGTEVRAHLTTEGRQALWARTGIQRELLSGTLMEQRASSVVFWVRSVSGFESDASFDNLYQQIDIPRQDVLRLDRKKLDVFRTGATVAIGLGAAGFTLYNALKGEPGISVDGTEPGPVDNIRVPFLLVRLFLPH